MFRHNGFICRAGYTRIWHNGSRHDRRQFSGFVWGRVFHKVVYWFQFPSSLHGMKLVGMKIILYWYEIHTAVWLCTLSSSRTTNHHLVTLSGLLRLSLYLRLICRLLLDSLVTELMVLGTAVQVVVFSVPQIFLAPSAFTVDVVVDDARAESPESVRCCRRLLRL